VLSNSAKLELLGIEQGNSIVLPAQYDPDAIANQQLEFFKRCRAGCLFAAVAARNPTKYGWKQQVVVRYSTEEIDKLISEAIESPKVTMLSLIFPTVTSPEALVEFIHTLQQCDSIFLEQATSHEGATCLGLRAHINSLSSWISGFGPFEFFPKTRQSPYTEITLRVKPRPAFKWVMKQSPPNVIHLADLDMLGIADALFKTLWYSTFARVEKVLGHKPNTQSAAKTTFSVPEDLWSQISSSN